MSSSDGNGRIDGNGRFEGSKQRMNNMRLHHLILGVADNVEGQLGMWQLQFGEGQAFVITDESHNRMRIMMPVIEDEQLTEEDFRTILSANFDRALDARYALDQGVLWSVFIHPLGELTDDQFLDGLRQVIRLVDNYGTSYASTDLFFGG